MAKKQWSDLTESQQRAVVIVGAVEVVTSALALRDLARRPAEDVNGPKWLWALACFVQPVGPLAYFLKGRR